MLRRGVVAQVLPEDWPRRTIIVIQWAATFFRSLLIAAMVALVAGVGELLGLRIGGLALVVGVYGVAGFVLVLVLVVFAIHDLVEITRCPPRPAVSAGFGSRSGGLKPGTGAEHLWVLWSGGWTPTSGTT